MLWSFSHPSPSGCFEALHPPLSVSKPMHASPTRRVVQYWLFMSFFQLAEEYRYLAWVG